MLLPAETIHELTGEEVEPAECSAVLSHRSFDAAFSKYIEWHAPQLQSEQLIFYTERRHRAAIGASLEVMIL